MFNYVVVFTDFTTCSLGSECHLFITCIFVKAVEEKEKNIRTLTSKLQEATEALEANEKLLRDVNNRMLDSKLLPQRSLSLLMGVIFC